MIALGAKNVDFSENRNLDMDDINELLDKINNLEVKLQHKECLAEELKRYEKVDLENEDLKKEIKIFEETIRKIGQDDQNIVNASNDLRRQFD